MQSNYINEKALGYQQLVGPTAAGLNVPAGTKLIMISVEGQAVRWRADGTPPTGTVGMPIAAGGGLNFTGSFAAMQALQFTQQAATATVNATFFANGEY